MVAKPKRRHFITTGPPERSLKLTPEEANLEGIFTLLYSHVDEFYQQVALDKQVKLLRVLQEGEFERVGGTKTLKVQVRVIAATNRNLEAEVQAGRFRADLYYRLNVFPIQSIPCASAKTTFLYWCATSVTNTAPP